ncbi:unnamed protein product [Meloidogyne enterolobii]|uniref:Uncharacterized protein n=1 Tax=Meloidogyne enterolobii TaxID=390850 RepID=A0ACB0ZP06_MELEN
MCMPQCFPSCMIMMPQHLPPPPPPPPLPPPPPPAFVVFLNK